MKPVELRPLSFGEVLDTAFNLFRRNFKVVIVVSAVFMIPIAILSALASAGLAPTNLSVLENPNASPEEILSVMVGLLGATSIGALLPFVGGIFVQAGTTMVYAETYRGESMPLKPALRIAVRKFPAMLGLTLLSTLGSLVGFVLCIIPGVWISNMWAVSAPALIAEDAGPVAALKRSFALVKGMWWRTFGLILVANLLVGLVVGAVTTPIQLGVSFSTAFTNPEAALSGGYFALNSLLSGLATAITLPFSAAVVVAVYYDLRVRKEAFDLDRLIASLPEIEAPAGPPPGDETDPFGLG